VLRASLLFAGRRWDLNETDPLVDDAGGAIVHRLQRLVHVRALKQGRLEPAGLRPNRGNGQNQTPGERFGDAHAHQDSAASSSARRSSVWANGMVERPRSDSEAAANRVS